MIDPTAMQGEIDTLAGRLHDALQRVTKLGQENYMLHENLWRLTDAIDDFLNDTREKESVEQLEWAMKAYGTKEKP